MPVFRAFFASLLLAALWIATAASQSPFGPKGAEAEPNRAQAWLVPSPDPDVASHALLFRPPGEGPFRLAVIAHASTQNVLLRAQMPQPEYRTLASFLVARGFAVLVPERPGHGATGGKYLEDQHGCDEANYARSGRATAEEISDAVTYLRGQPFIRRDGAVVMGSPPADGARWRWPMPIRLKIAAIIVFAPGRGGHANNFPNQICAPDILLAAAGNSAMVRAFPSAGGPANDSYFSPGLSRGNWRMRFAPAAARPTSPCCRPMTAKATGWPRTKTASNWPRANWIAR